MHVHFINSFLTIKSRLIFSSSITFFITYTNYTIFNTLFLITSITIIYIYKKSLKLVLSLRVLITLLSNVNSWEEEDLTSYY